MAGSDRAPAAPADPARPAWPPTTLTTLRAAALLAAAGIGLQIAYILLPASAERAVEIGSVLAFALAAVVHAVAVRGVRWGLLVALTVAALALAVEAAGTATGFPFGPYSYTGTLGLQVAGVPLLVPLAWLWMAYPSYLAGQALAGRRWGWLAGAWTLAAWDLFLDPQRVEAGDWVWDDPTPALPGVPGIPLTNYAGWLLTAVAMMLAIDAVGRATARRTRLPDPGHLPADTVPAAVLVWTYASSVLANLVFFGRPAVAAWGGVLMGLTVLPYLWVLRRDLRRLAAARTRAGATTDDPPAP